MCARCVYARCVYARCVHIRGPPPSSIWNFSVGRCCVHVALHCCPLRAPSLSLRLLSPRRPVSAPLSFCEKFICSEWCRRLKRSENGNWEEEEGRSRRKTSILTFSNFYSMPFCAEAVRGEFWAIHTQRCYTTKRGPFIQLQHLSRYRVYSIPKIIKSFTKNSDNHIYSHICNSVQCVMQKILFCTIHHILHHTSYFVPYFAPYILFCTIHAILYHILHHTSYFVPYFVYGFVSYHILYFVPKIVCCCLFVPTLCVFCMRKWKI